MRERKRKYKDSHPVETKIRYMAENLHKRLYSEIDNPRNKSYKDKGVLCKIGGNSAEIYEYLVRNFYDDVANILSIGEIPSLDRIESDGHYEEGNLRIIPFYENARLGRETSLKVCSKPIIIEFDDGRVEEYMNAVEAGKHSGISTNILRNHLYGKVKNKKDFVVKYIS